MESIKCDICGKDRPQQQMVPVEYEDEGYAVCVFCLEEEMFGREMEFPATIQELVFGR